MLAGVGANGDGVVFGAAFYGVGWGIRGPTRKVLQGDECVGIVVAVFVGKHLAVGAFRGRIGGFVACDTANHGLFFPVGSRADVDDVSGFGGLDGTTERGV
ncbi:MAG TPA: hypothetical protein PLM08_25785, partial [Polyangiaceae bacterium]|nr:hypothetical protein [Polyangiaceae bacterium]